ncbi:hypothetical protein RCL1_003805 [Eukaryota sp. TZLM3-RCL]
MASPKPVLKHPPASHQSPKGPVSFDEESLSYNEQQLRELAEFYGEDRRRIDEPKTPFHHSFYDSDTSASVPLSPAAPNQAVVESRARELQDAVQLAFDSGDIDAQSVESMSSDEDFIEEIPKSPVHDPLFEKKRSSHYQNIGALLKRKVVEDE